MNVPRRFIAPNNVEDVFLEAGAANTGGYCNLGTFEFVSKLPPYIYVIILSDVHKADLHAYVDLCAMYVFSRAARRDGQSDEDNNTYRNVSNCFH